MPQTKTEIRAILDELDAPPRHRLGQNFMIDGNILRIIADAGNISPDDLVLEIGPGTGTLTQELLARGAIVTAIEIDKKLAEFLRKQFAGNSKFRLIEGDALDGKHALNPELLAVIREAKSLNRTVRLVANLPYQIASPLVVQLLMAGVDLLAFTVQKEVAERLAASPDSKVYGPLSIVTQLLSRVEICRTIPPQAFWPMPKIHSALVRVTRDDRLRERAELFSSFVHRVFSSRRKTLRNALTRAGTDEHVALPSGIDPQSRSEQVSPEQFLELFERCKPPTIVE